MGRVMVMRSALRDRHVICILALIIVCVPLIQPCLAETYTVNFDDLDSGTKVYDQYAGSLVHFFNDYHADKLFKSSPEIFADSTAPSPPNVLFNGFYNLEEANSENAALGFWFEKPVSTVQLKVLHPRHRGSEWNNTVVDMYIRAYDCAGVEVNHRILTGMDSDTLITLPQGFRSIRMVTVDYGDAQCGEMIDNLVFTTTSGSGDCPDAGQPQVIIDTHTDSQVVNSPHQTIEGRVTHCGVLDSVKLNGIPTDQVYRTSAGEYHFTAEIDLPHEGANPVVMMAEDKFGNRGAAAITLYLGIPVSISLKQFHLTQRGVMKEGSCDVDSPLVTGKSAKVRIALDARTASGAETYVDSVRMEMYRLRDHQLELVDTFESAMYSPYTSFIHSPSEMAEIHFWIPGDKIAIDSGKYSFKFQPYVGSDPVGEPFFDQCGPGSPGSHQFEETKPVRLLLMPIEISLEDSRQYYNTTEIVARYLWALENTLPVRDGGSTVFEDRDTGVIYGENAPFKLCDGSQAMNQLYPDFCSGTGFLWKFIDKNSSGVLSRATVSPVNNFRSRGNWCDNAGINSVIIGGMDTGSGWEGQIQYDPTVGVFRPGDIMFCPTLARDPDCCNKYTVLIDEDHDGVITVNDVTPIAAEFFDTTLPIAAWSTNLENYTQGNTFRFFRDTNNNQCHDSGEPVADVWKKFDTLEARLPVEKDNGLNELNKAVAGVGGEQFPYGIFVFTQKVHPDLRAAPGFPLWGPGQSHWITTPPYWSSTLAHEMGHQVGGLGERYDHIPDDFQTGENAWTTYIGYESFPPFAISYTMSVSREWTQTLHNKTDYRTLFNTLKIDPPSGLGSLSSLQAIQDQFILSGFVSDDNQLTYATISTGSGLVTTPADSSSPFKLVFGDGTVLLEFPIPVDSIPPPDGQGGTVNGRLIHVVTPLPAGTRWIEVRYNDEVLGRFENPGEAPSVRMVYPNDGESFGASQPVNVRWETGGADETRLRATVYYLPEAGSDRLIVLGSGVAGNEFPWNTADTPGTTGTGGKIKVMVSDGFNSAEDESDGTFSVADKPPSAVILTPLEGKEFLQFERIPLEGFIHDPEGQAGEASWAVDGAPAGSGTMVWVGPLSPGDHEVVLSVQDRAGLTSSDEVSITVVADSDRDGMSDAFEDRYGLQPGDPLDAADDDDGDGLVNFDEAWYRTAPDNPDTDGDGISDGAEVSRGTDPATPPNRPPVANAGPDQRVAAGKDCQATVVFDGTRSSDPDGDALTYLWENSFGSIHGESPAVIMPLGEQTITLTVDDGEGGTDSDEVTITVSDTSPPVIQDLTVSPNVLWPANHKMVPVTIHLTATDNCAKQVSCSITSVRSNEPENGLGEGDTAPDWSITEGLSAQLRAERSGKGTGRIYTLTAECADASGNSAVQEVTVTVPHDQGKQK